MTEENKPLTGVTISAYCGSCKSGGCEHVAKRLGDLEAGAGPSKLVDQLEKMLCETVAQLEGSREAARYTAKCYAEEMARADRAEAMAAVAKVEINREEPTETTKQAVDERYLDGLEEDRKTLQDVVALYNESIPLGSVDLGSLRIILGILAV